MNPKDKIAKATDLIRVTILLMPGFIVFLVSVLTLATIVSAAPITHQPLSSPPLQYWYTVDIPMDGGVYPLEVYAPALPKVEPKLFDIGDPPSPPPRPVDVPEPGTWWLLGFALGYFVLWQAIRWDQRRENRKWQETVNKFLKLAERYTKGFNNMHYALQRIVESRNLQEAREIARKALEETGMTRRREGAEAMKFKLNPNQHESDVIDSISRIVSPIFWDSIIQPDMPSYRLDYGNNWFAKVEDDVLTISYRYATGQSELMEAYARVIAHQTGMERMERIP